MANPDPLFNQTLLLLAGEVLAPGAFIPIAEETGIFVYLGSFVIERAARELAAACAPGTAVVSALEPLIAAARGSVVWGDFPETTPSGLCFTSGTTGAPKGVCLSLEQMTAVCGSLALRVAPARVEKHLTLLPNERKVGVTHDFQGLCATRLLAPGP